MSPRANGQIRRSQVITTYGPGALIDLPSHSAIVGGLDTWPRISDLEEIVEPRLASKLEGMTGVARPRLYAPPPDSDDPRERSTGIGAGRFPQWHVVRELTGSADRDLSRRLVHRSALDDRMRIEGRPVVATRFVQACPKGHVEDVHWYWFVHGSGDSCRRQLWQVQSVNMNGEGRFLTFSAQPMLTEPNGAVGLLGGDVFVYDLISGESSMVSRTYDGTHYRGEPFGEHPIISEDEQLITFFFVGPDTRTKFIRVVENPLKETIKSELTEPHRP